MLSHHFNTSSNKMASIQVREVVKDNVFPKAKFLREEDVKYSDDPNSWCQKMAEWCHIDPKTVPLWWPNAKKSLLEEVQQQRANKTNTLKREFFGK